MKVISAPLEGILVIEPRIFKDERGWFLETYHIDRYREAGLTLPFVQDNWSRSIRGTLRGLHFQEPRPQGKLVWVTQGAVWDVAVDIRSGSPNFGKWFGVELSAESRRQIWVPPGFAHGFCVLSETADVTYKCTDVWVPSADRSLLWSDPEIGIDWPVKAPLLSPKDAVAPRLRDATTLPTWV